MTDGTWDDYVDLSGVDATDPSQAVPAINAEVTDFAANADTIGGGVSDLDQVTLDTAAYQTDLAEGQQSWADWNSDIATGASADAAASYEDATTALAQGDVSGAEWSLNQADIAATTAADATDTAAGYEQTTGDYLAAADSSLDSVDYSALDTSAADTTSYDTGSDY
ncbi:hypothetical protein [Nocardioides sp.]|uniref:hypothetical protein n=1 Tax=Nocardioides sp. TaxID=35761 RepID=UPI002725E7F0|nr:hypothetical protein [Nocardioides sp.]MDO9455533.1 hypothetical protein [Nocardioides sp.]